MLREELCGVESQWAEPESLAGDQSHSLRRHGIKASGGSKTKHGTSENAHTVDRELRRIAKTRSGLDAEEARWLRRAGALAIWPTLGYVNGLEYLEDVFGYAPRTAQERLRVASELGALPEIECALDAGAVPWSVARELTRVATPATQARWLAEAAGKNLRDVERLVAGHAKGDDPDDPTKPELVEQTVPLRLKPATVALLREARNMLADERGEHLDDDALVEEMCRRVLSGGGDSTSERPARTIHITTCRVCRKATQNGSGVPFDLSSAERELAECDAIICDDEGGKRATQTIPPVTRRKVMERDGHKCRFPGCRAARNLDVHHLRPRAHGGAHTTSNLACLCSGHHRLLHDALVTAAGDADGVLTFCRDGKRIAEAVHAHTAGLSSAHATTVSTAPMSRYAAVERRTMTKTALQQAGFKASIAAHAASAASERMSPDASLEAWIKEALKHCT